MERAQQDSEINEKLCNSTESYRKSVKQIFIPGH